MIQLAIYFLTIIAVGLTLVGLHDWLMGRDA